MRSWEARRAEGNGSRDPKRVRPAGLDRRPRCGWTRLREKAGSAVGQCDSATQLQWFRPPEAPIAMNFPSGYSEGPRVRGSLARPPHTAGDTRAESRTPANASPTARNIIREWRGTSHVT